MKVSIYHASEVPGNIAEQIGFADQDDYYNILVVTNSSGEIVLWESDNMEPEDAYFTRDLSWIPEIIEKAYELGMEHCYSKAVDDSLIPNLHK